MPRERAFEGWSLRSKLEGMALLALGGAAGFIGRRGFTLGATVNAFAYFVRRGCASAYLGVVEREVVARCARAVRSGEIVQ